MDCFIYSYTIVSNAILLVRLYYFTMFLTSAGSDANVDPVKRGGKCGPEPSLDN